MISGNGCLALNRANRSKLLVTHTHKSEVKLLQVEILRLIERNSPLNVDEIVKLRISKLQQAEKDTSIPRFAERDNRCQRESFDLDMMTSTESSSTSPTSNGIDMTSQNSNAGSNNNPTNDAMKVEDLSFIIPRVALANDKDNYSAFANMNEEKMNKANAKSFFTKRIAGLTSNDKKDIPNGDNGNGSAFNGNSAIAIINLNPNPDPTTILPNAGDKKERKERWYHTILQVSLPFLIAGMGTIGAGRVLTVVKDQPAFKEVPQLLILITALQGLKGNLDMCLASRLCTQANLGNMTNWREISKMIIGNIALVQIQAIVAAICLSLFGMGVGAINGNVFSWERILLLAVSCMCTATSSCFILDFVMIAVILISYRFKMNPDNLATPLAASIGDVVSISILSIMASEFFSRINSEIWVLYTVFGSFLALLPFWILIVLKNKYTRSVLRSGWVPILSALLISGGGGLVLEKTIDSYKGFEVFQPVINGIGGNLVSVQASRMSTLLHQTSIMGSLDKKDKIWVSPWRALFFGTPYAKTARLLVSMAIPGQLVFVFIADAMNPGNCRLHVYFVLIYITVSAMQVMLLLYIAHIIIHAMWRFKIDPDNSAIPYLTALGDLSGSLLLTLAFYVIYAINRPYCIAAAASFLPRLIMQN
ncbi:hypothetical protein HN011_004812 [Eciton burchellii]|nr:hypothetical protein HN011_004812 [Eciton burchellii]